MNIYDTDLDLMLLHEDDQTWDGHPWYLPPEIPDSILQWSNDHNQTV